jgi:hypothetical protein
MFIFIFDEYGQFSYIHIRRIFVNMNMNLSNIRASLPVTVVLQLRSDAHGAGRPGTCLAIGRISRSVNLEGIENPQEHIALKTALIWHQWNIEGRK